MFYVLNLIKNKKCFIENQEILLFIHKYSSYYQNLVFSRPTEQLYILTKASLV